VVRFHFRAALALRSVDESKGLMLTLSALQLGGAVAQLGARLDGIEEVVGSNPIGSTKFHFQSECAAIHPLTLALFPFE
jgi:hypothetical protein